MKTTAPSLERIGFKTGLITFVALLGFFMIMKLLGFADVLELRFFNGIILAIGVCYGINKFKRELNEDEFYLKGIAQGFYIAAVAVTSFALFMSIYISFFDISLLQHIKDRYPNMGTSLNGFTIFLSIFMEGMASSAIITFAAMQYFKRSGNTTKPYREKESRETNSVYEQKG